MKLLKNLPKLFFISYLLMTAFFTAQAQEVKDGIQNNILEESTILTAYFGPPAENDVWQKFIIPLEASSFGIEETEFVNVMQSVKFIRIRTEMGKGFDVGSLDSVVFGDAFISTFNENAEGWSAMGDGYLQWEAMDGAQGGYITITDGSTGQYHFAGAPSAWSGDLTDQIGKVFSFYNKTSLNSYGGFIEIHTIEPKRLRLLVDKYTLKGGESKQMKILVSPVPTEEETIYLNCSDIELINIVSSVVIAANDSVVNVTITASDKITEENSAIITASSVDYYSTQIGLTVESETGLSENFSILGFSVYPNPTNNKINIVFKDGEVKPFKYSLYNNLGQQVQKSQVYGSNLSLNLDAYPSGVYTLMISREGSSEAVKIIVD